MLYPSVPRTMRNTFLLLIAHLICGALLMCPAYTEVTDMYNSVSEREYILRSLATGGQSGRHLEYLCWPQSSPNVALVTAHATTNEKTPGLNQFQDSWESRL